MVPRLARQDVTLSGVDIPAGAFVRLCVACVNRDPTRFEVPTEIRLDRTLRRHFAFGSGVHHCIGAPLARRIIAAAITPFLDPGRRLRAAEPLDSIPYYLSPTACAPMRLRIAL
jgi:cytochrome P450